MSSKQQGIVMEHGGIEVWTARPEKVGAAACSALAGLLDAHERERAEAFRFDADRQAFVIAHALRRLALACALGADPGELQFTTGAHGKPLLLGADAATPAFSLTRSRGLVACAVGHQRFLGVDVEPVRPGLSPSLLESFVTPAHGAAFLDDTPDLFMQWTALEAFWKARGTGLSTTQPRIGLHALEGEDCYEIVDGESRLPTGVVVMRLPAPAGHVLALACEQIASVQLVELDRLAPRPAGADDVISMCNEGLCEEASAFGTGGSSTLV
ncbi:4'-phosphopantetheinyl transferase family protein [Ramlibacter sp. MMS24-I3-19]|uniref:4'-phosphopantetheinyl transferase family protein n=1 Tax=Ramlibacter sp. MMS24-I3-19 TaxID=3416606 RepID=UPI003CFE6B7A